VNVSLKQYSKVILDIQAKAEVLAHGVDWAEFVEEVGSKSVYKSNEVLEWLGY
jgi:hypothetical protein